MFKLKTNRIHYKIAYDPDIVPPISLMKTEGIDVLEEWFRWGEEWSMLLRVYGNLNAGSNVLEIGCGLGRTAFPLRYLLFNNGKYNGFEICKFKIDFLQNSFQKKYPNFEFLWADIFNTYYNPSGKIDASKYIFQYPDEKFDVVYAASVFTHMMPQNAAQYFKESARVLKKNGRCVFSFFLLDYFKPGLKRPLGFDRPDFDFKNFLPEYNDKFSFVVPENPEQMTAYKLDLISELASNAGLQLIISPIAGIWSGSQTKFIGAQDIIVLAKI